MQTTIIIPCYNEKERLPVDAFLYFVKNQTNIRFLFVNDGSTDNTAEILQDISIHNTDCFEVLSLTRNKGKSEAVRQGMLYAVNNFESHYIGFWDADLATPLYEIVNFIDCIERINCQVIIGCRRIRSGANIQRQHIRYYLGRILAIISSKLLTLNLYDTQCGAKLFRAEVVSLLFEKPFISRWLFDLELLARFINMFGLEAASKNIYEYSLSSWKDIDGSSIKIKDILTVPIELWSIKKKYLKKPE